MTRHARNRAGRPTRAASRTREHGEERSELAAGGWFGRSRKAPRRRPGLPQDIVTHTDLLF